jgi:hypothetical protein
MRRFVWLGLLASPLLGCGNLLGLGEFDDAAPGAGGAGSTTTTTASTSGTGGASSSSTTTSSADSTTSTSSGMTCTPGEVVDCAYTADPPSSQDVGPCHAGTQECLQDGSGFDDCVGEVGPQPEDCANPGIDEDCDGTPDDTCACVPGTKTSCYTGPNGTENVGLCKAGSAACDADGLGYMACMGDILPSPETCADVADEDCNAVECALWAKRMGDASDQYIIGVGSNAQDEVYVAGNFTGALDIGAGNQFSVGANDLWVAKLKADGSPVWFTAIPGIVAGHMKVDGQGNVVVTGSFSGTVTVGGMAYTAVGAGDQIVIRFGSAGAVLWARALDTVNTTSIALTTNDDILVTGMLTSALDLGTGALPYAGAADVYFARLAASDGHTIFAKSIGSAGLEEGVAIAASGAGLIDVFGYYNGPLSIGGNALTPASAANFRTFLAQYDANGVYQLSTSYGFFSYPLHVVIPSSGKIYLGINFSGTIDTGGIAAQATGPADGVIAEYTSGGFLQKLTQVGGTGAESITALATDPAGNVLVAFDYTETLSFAGANLSAIGTKDVGIAKLDSQTNLVWTRGFPGLMNSNQQVVVGASKGSLGVLAAGYFQGDTNVGGIPLPAAGGADAFVASFLAQ